MSNQLEQFIKDHRDEFDSEEPARKSWDNIPQADATKGAPAKLIRMSFVRWSAVAAMVVLVAGGIWFYNRDLKQSGTNNLPTVNPVAAVEQKPTDTTNHQQAIAVPLDTASSHLAIQNTTPAATNNEPSAEDDMRAEMAHFAGLVEIKHRELKKIEKDEPLLYKQFAGDVNKLDSVYNNLKKQLPKNPNREQLLEAMIQNLQLQMGLLNHQLEIIKQINHSKKSAYEKAYKSI